MKSSTMRTLKTKSMMKLQGIICLQILSLYMIHLTFTLLLSLYQFTLGQASEQQNITSFQWVNAKTGLHLQCVGVMFCRWEHLFVYLYFAVIHVRSIPLGNQFPGVHAKIILYTCAYVFQNYFLKQIHDITLSCYDCISFARKKFSS